MSNKGKDSVVFSFDGGKTYKPYQRQFFPLRTEVDCMVGHEENNKIVCCFADTIVRRPDGYLYGTNNSISEQRIRKNGGYCRLSGDRKYTPQRLEEYKLLYLHTQQQNELNEINRIEHEVRTKMSTLNIYQWRKLNEFMNNL